MVSRSAGRIRSLVPRVPRCDPEIVEHQSRQYRGPDDQRIHRVLCIVAHPDDAEFFCGGTLLLLARAGAEVDLVVVTSGDKGARELDLDRPTLAARREREQLAAARILRLSQRWPDRITGASRRVSPRDPTEPPGPPHHLRSDTAVPPAS
jgi:hypothetical protein